MDDQLAYEQRNLLEIINKLEAGMVQVRALGGGLFFRCDLMEVGRGWLYPERSFWRLTLI